MVAVFGAASAFALLAGCAEQRAGDVGPAVAPPLGVVQSQESGPGGAGLPGPTAESDRDASGAGSSRQFNAGSDRVDSAVGVSDQRQDLVSQATREYFSGRPNLSLVSVRAADESPRRSAAHAVVNDNGVPVELALTVELRQGTWRVTNALALNVGASR